MTHHLFKVIFYSTCTLTISCGGGGGSSPTTTSSFYEKPARYSADAYNNFVSQKSSDDLEGVWVMLTEGDLARGNTPVVNGRDDKIEHQYYARSTVRIKRKTGTTNEYYIYTCGLGGARDTSSVSTASNIFIPFIYYSSGSWSSYSANIIDAQTMQIPDMNRNWDWVGDSGLAISYKLSSTLKRISDDPFQSVSSISDTQTGNITNNGCVYEDEGAYVATESPNFKQQGTFNTVLAFSDSLLDNDISSYLKHYTMKNYVDFSAYYSFEGVDFSSGAQDLISVNKSTSSNTSSYTINASSSGNTGSTSDSIFDINL